MSNLIKKQIDKDLMVLDEITEDCSIESRNWDSIITIYNINNKPFPIPALVCSKIIEDVKKGLIPHMVFKQYGISYSAFKNRYSKVKTILEELSVQSELTDSHWQIINTCRNDPAFILGQDIDRATAFHFNECTKTLEELSVNAQTYERYMMLTHPEEFNKKEKENNVELVIKIAPGLLENI